MTTDTERAYGIPEAYSAPLDEIVRDRAAEARHGGRVFRDHFNRLRDGMDMRNVVYWATRLATGQVRDRHFGMVDARHDTMLPEAAFDWPIYRAALGLTDDERDVLDHGAGWCSCRARGIPAGHHLIGGR